MKTIAEAHKEYYAIWRAWCEKYRLQIEERLTKKYPDIHFVMRIHGMQDDEGLFYHVYSKRDGEDKLLTELINIEQDLRPEFPEIMCYWWDIEYLPDERSSS